MQKRGRQRCQGHKAEQDERGGRRQETVKRESRIDGRIGRNRTGRGENAGNVLLWNGDDTGSDFVPPRPLAGRDQECRENRGEEYSNAGTEQSHLDGVANEKNPTERERKAADPDDPLRAEPFLQRCRRRCGHGRCGRGRLGNFGSGHGFDNDRRRLGGLYRGRGSRLCSLSNTWRTGVRCLQHRDAMLKSPHPIAGIQRHHQSDDGDDRYCQDQKPNYDDFRHRSSPGWISRGNATLPGRSRIAAVRPGGLKQIELERVAFGCCIAEADSVDCTDHAAVAFEHAVRNRDDA